MTTNTTGSPEELATKRLTELILKGDENGAGESAREMSTRSSDANDVVDTISDAMNIVADLHEVESYSSKQVEDCERAAEMALEAVRPRIRVEQTKISGRVMVTSLQGDPHSFDKTLLMTMLEIGGFTALDGGTDLSPSELVEKIIEMKPDVVAVPLVTSTAAKNLLETSSLIAPGSARPHMVAYGRGVSGLNSQPGLGAVEDTLGALSKITEMLMKP